MKHIIQNMKDNYEFGKTKKQTLREKYRQNISTFPRPRVKIEVDQEIVNETTKKEIKLLKEKYEKQKEVAQTQVTDLKKQLIETKKKMFQNDFELRNIRIQYKSIVAKLEKREDELQKKDYELNKLKKELEVLKAASESYLHSINSHRVINKQLKEHIRKLVNDTAMNKKDRIIKELTEKIDKQKKYIQSQKEVIQGLSKPTVGQLLSKLSQSLSINNATEFYSVLKIADQVKNYLDEKKKQMLSSENDSSTSVDKLSNEFVSSDFGYVIKEGEQWVFYNLDNIFYEIDSRGPFIILDELPTEVLIVNGKAVVINQYHDQAALTEKSKTTSRTIKKKKLNGRSDAIYPYFGDLRVLLVTGINNHKLSARLQKHGIVAEFHNPFEESEQLLENKYDRADMVIVLTNSVSHSIYGKIERKAPHVEEMDTENVEKIVARIRYLGIKLGLIKVHNDIE